MARNEAISQVDVFVFGKSDQFIVNSKTVEP
jgi:hypothetical protein